MKTSIIPKNPTHRVTAALFGVLALSCGALSIAADNSDVPQAVVKFSDLNVSSAQGAAVLYSRIAAAANQVCKAFDSKDLGSRSRRDACVHKAITDAVVNVGQPALFAIENAKSHRSLPIIVAAAQTREF
jgi:UrcA family protein